MHPSVRTRLLSYVKNTLLPLSFRKIFSLNPAGEKLHPPPDATDGKAHTWPSCGLTQDPSREPFAIDLQAKDWRTDELHLQHTGKRPFRERLFVEIPYSVKE